MKKLNNRRTGQFEVKPLTLAILGCLAVSAAEAVVYTGQSVGSKTYASNVTSNTALVTKTAIAPISVTAGVVPGVLTISGSDYTLSGTTYKDGTYCLEGVTAACYASNGVMVGRPSSNQKAYSTYYSPMAATTLKILNEASSANIQVGLLGGAAKGPLNTSAMNLNWFWMPVAPTAAASIPVTGSANFTGMAAGNFSVGTRNGLFTSTALAQANLATRTITFNTDGTIVGSPLLQSGTLLPVGAANAGAFIPDTAYQAPGLNLTGSMTWLAGANTFSGTVSNKAGTVPGSAAALAAGALTGTISGGFAGATGNELGGVFSASNLATTQLINGAFTASQLNATTALNTLTTPNSTMVAGGLVAPFTIYADPNVGSYLGGLTLSPIASRSYTVRTDSNGVISRITDPTNVSVALYANPTNWLMQNSLTPVYMQQPFGTAQSVEHGVPLGFMYSGLGAWNGAAGAATSAGSRVALDWHAYGVTTPVVSIPVTGTAQYQGVLFGHYVDGSTATTADGFIRGNAGSSMNFATRALAFSTVGTVISPGMGSYVQSSSGGVTFSVVAPNAMFDTLAPGLNLSGNLTYVAAGNNFSGAVTNAAGADGLGGTLAAGALAGTATVQLNGTTGQELSGVFSLKNATSTQGMAGAVVAKQVSATPVLQFGQYNVTGQEVAGAYTATLGATVTQTSSPGVVSAKAYTVNTRGRIYNIVDGAASYLLVPGAGLSASTAYLADPNYMSAMMTSTATGPFWSDYNTQQSSNGQLVFAYSNFGMKASDPVAGVAANTMTQNWSWHAYGVATPVASMPVTLTGTYIGLAMGDYMNGALDQGRFLSSAIASANFATRAITFTTTGTVADSFSNPANFLASTGATLGLGGGVSAPGLNLTGTLTYAAGSNNFSGAVSNTAGVIPGNAVPGGTTTVAAAAMSGTATGQFNGPAANELSGVLSLSNAGGTLTMNGAFAASKVATTTPLMPNRAVALTGLETALMAAGALTAPAPVAKTMTARTGGLGELTWLTDGVVTQGLNVQSGERHNGIAVSAWGAATNGNTLFEVNPSAAGWTNVANLPWSYTTLGAWDKVSALGVHSVTWHSVGLPTVATSIPATGVFTFTGLAAGDSNGRTFQSNMSATVDFALRNVGFSTTNSVANPVMGSGLGVAYGLSPVNKASVGVAAPELNISGNLTYAAGTNSFAGAVANSVVPMPGMPATTTMTGTAKGQFNGPTATEMGGVFSLTGVGGQMQGAFAARR